MRSRNSRWFGCGILAVAAITTSACLSLPCEERGNCPGDFIRDTGVGAETPGPSTNEADGSSPFEGGASANDAADFLDAAHLDATTTAARLDASQASDGASDGTDADLVPSTECTVDEECASPTPVCDETVGACVRCTANSHCESPAGLCLTSENSRTNRCVECTDDSDCTTTRPICSANECHLCDRTSGEGCSASTPVCTANDNDERLCVECEQDTDCADSSDGQICYRNQCSACSLDDSAGCSPAAPVCVVDGSLTRCVQCADNDDCPMDTPICSWEQCVECDVTTHAGCDAETPYCAPLDAKQAEAEATSGGKLDSGSDAALSDALEGYLAGLVCVECRDDDDCSGSTPACVDAACVQCAGDTDCSDPSAATCDLDANTCVPCSGLGECAHLADTPACNLDNGQCVECTAQEAERCGATTCSTVPGTAQFTCSTQDTGSALACQSCVGDAACASGLGCVQETFDETETGWYCLPQQPADSGCTAQRPYIGSVESSSVDGMPGPYCRPRHTTCTGYLNHGRGPNLEEGTSCATHEDCGLPGVDDGLCVPWSDSNRCTYVCVLPEDCKTASTCGPAPVGTDVGGNDVCSF